MTVLVTQSGGVNPTMPVLSMTYASVLVPVAFPQSSLPIHHYLSTLPSPYALGQQVTAYQLSYCSVLSRVLIVWS